MPIDGYLQFAADPIFLNPQVADFLLTQQLQKLTVRNGLHDTTFEKKKLNEGEHD
ncbi:hypothetical protein D3C72_2545150 [compost metagenome]